MAREEESTAPVSDRVVVGSDHAAVDGKRVVVDVLAGLGIEVEDLGADGSESVDYPDYALRVAEAVAGGQAARGVLLCGTGIGMSIAANKVAGIRAALVYDVDGARMSRLHNDANILVMGGRVLDEAAIREIVRVWLETGFEGGRHARRVGKISEIEARGPRGED